MSVASYLISLVPEVLSEVRDKQTRQQLTALPFEITVREPSPEAYNAGI